MKWRQRTLPSLVPCQPGQASVCAQLRAGWVLVCLGQVEACCASAGWKAVCVCGMCVRSGRGGSVCVFVCVWSGRGGSVCLCVCVEW